MRLPNAGRVHQVCRPLLVDADEQGGALPCSTHSHTPCTPCPGALLTAPCTVCGTPQVPYLHRDTDAGLVVDPRRAHILCAFPKDGKFPQLPQPPGPALCCALPTPCMASPRRTAGPYAPLCATGNSRHSYCREPFLYYGKLVPGQSFEGRDPRCIVSHRPLNPTLRYTFCVLSPPSALSHSSLTRFLAWRVCRGPLRCSSSIRPPARLPHGQRGPTGHVRRPEPPVQV